MKDRKKVPLSQICKLNMGQSPSSDSYNENKDGLPFFQGNADFGDLYPTERIWCNQPTKIAQKGDILLSVRAPIGALNIAKKECCIGRGLAALSPIPSQCTLMYLYYALKSQVKILERQGTGSTFKAVGKDKISALQIPFYDLKEQELIISELTCIDTGICNVHKQFSKLDTLVKSRFIEMFGDPVTNPMGWESKKLKDICTVGSSKRVYQSEQTSTGVPFLRISDLVSRITSQEECCDLYISEEKFSDFAKHGLVPKVGDILVTARGTLGLCYIIKPNDRFYFQDGMISWVHTSEAAINPVYVSYLFNSQGIRRQIDSVIAGSTVAYLSIAQLGQFDILMPPLDLQNQFAAFVEQTDKSKAVLHKLLEKQELLRAALMQEYFGY